VLGREKLPLLRLQQLLALRVLLQTLLVLSGTVGQPFFASPEQLKLVEEDLFVVALLKVGDQQWRDRVRRADIIAELE